MQLDNREIFSRGLHEHSCRGEITVGEERECVMVLHVLFLSEATCFVSCYNKMSSHSLTHTCHTHTQVKTTQPRRYLVRPNQGLIPPGGSEVVTILLVEKDKQVLLQSYDRLGQSALDHSKDKFLVQSITVSPDFAKSYQDTKRKGNNTKELSDALTSMWNAVSAGSTNANMFNKKLHVKLIVHEDQHETAGGGPPVPQRHDTPMATIENMTPEQMFAEITILRRKYDELVAFSVNLTAERDILNNTLEQTKRDLNREMAARASLETGGARGARRGGGGASRTSGTLSFMFLPLLMVAFAAFLAGVKLTTEHKVAFLETVPVIGPMVMKNYEDATTMTE